MTLLTDTSRYSTASTTQISAPLAITHSRKIRNTCDKIAKTFLAIGLVMMGASLVNLPVGRTINPLTLPLWQYASSVAAGSERFDLSDATIRVNQGIVHQEPRYVTPGENWLQAALGLIYGPIKRTQDTDRLLAGGIANCSERSQILKTIAESAGYQCRFVGLQGHVVLEVLDGDRWRMADPDYGVVFDLGVDSLALVPQRPVVVAALASRGHQGQTIATYLEILQSTSDNQLLPIGSPLSPRLYKVEQACAWLIWILPTVAILVGLSPVLMRPWIRGTIRIKRNSSTRGYISPPISRLSESRISTKSTTFAK